MQGNINLSINWREKKPHKYSKVNVTYLVLHDYFQLDNAVKMHHTCMHDKRYIKLQKRDGEKGVGRRRGEGSDMYRKATNLNVTKTELWSI